MSWLINTKDTHVRITIAAQPNGRRTEIVGILGDVLKIRVAAPPVDGAANEELVRFLAETLGLKQRDITLIKGISSRKKSFNISGLSPDEVRSRLLSDSPREL